jgi:EmrB/QacA subfamily drug resistance transporter
LNSTDPQTIDYNRKWLVLASVGMGIFLGTIDSSIVNIALPTMVNYFKTDFAIVQWVVLAYLLTLTTLMLSMGRLADMFGKKPIYTLGIILFTIGSLSCGLSPSIYLLIAARVFQGIGATMVTSLGMAIITESFPGKERGMALGINSAIVSVGIVLGPTLGGFILQNLSWHWIFFVNLPVGVIGTLMVLRFVPNYRPQGGQKFDYPGSVTLFIALLSLLIGLTIGQDRGFLEPIVLILFLISILFAAIFIYIELHSRQPLIEMEYFKNRSLRINLMTRLLSFLSLAGATLLMPFYLENVLGYNPQQTGLMLLVTPITVGIVAPISGTLSDRFGTRTISVIGLGMLVFGAYCITTLDANTTTIGYLLRFIPIGIGSGMFQSPNNSAIMGTAARERLGIMSGIVSISRTLGQTIGIALLGAVWASRTFYHAGKVFSEGATQAPALAQVAGQQDTFRGVIFLLLLGFGLGIWGLLDERHNEVIVSSQMAGK